MEKQIHIDASKLNALTCPRCKSMYFTKTYMQKYLPALMAGNPKPMTIAVELFACANCYWVITQDDIDQFKPGKDPSLQDKRGSNSMVEPKSLHHDNKMGDDEIYNPTT